MSARGVVVIQKQMKQDENTVLGKGTKPWG